MRKIITLLLVLFLAMVGTASAVNFNTFGYVTNVDAYGSGILITFRSDAQISAQHCGSNGLKWKVTPNQAHYQALLNAAYGSLNRLTRISQNTGAGPALCEGPYPVAQVIQVSSAEQ